MFFDRIRRSAKPVFIFLALVFALSFVFLGVGSGSSGIGDLLNGNFSFGGGSSGPSVSKAEDRVRRHPKDPAALRKLATALETKNRSEEAIAPLKRYVALRPKDSDALRELAGLYVSKGTGLRQEALVAQYDAQQESAGQLFSPGLTLGQNKTTGSDPISESLAARANTRYSDKVTEMQTVYGEARDVYRKLAKLTPTDATLQLELADASQTSGDATGAIAAYKRFLKLAPDDPNAPLVRQQIKALQQPTSVTQSAGG